MKAQGVAVKATMTVVPRGSSPQRAVDRPCGVQTMKRGSPSPPGHFQRGPGRVYTLLVSSLATLVVGLTALALTSRASAPSAPLGPVASLTQFAAEPSTATQPVSHAEASPSDHARPRVASPLVSRRQLSGLAIIAVGIGTLTLIPCRLKATIRETAESATARVEVIGIPILASLFPSSPQPANTQQSFSSRLLSTVVLAAEVVLCGAMLLVGSACYREPKLIGRFAEQPFDAYVAAVQLTADLVHERIQPRETGLG